MLSLGQQSSQQVLAGLEGWMPRSMQYDFRMGGFHGGAVCSVMLGWHVVPSHGELI